MSALRSPILDERGERAVSSVSWEAPRGSSPYFGWLGDDGFSTVRIESIQAMVPQQNFPGRSVLLLSTGAQMIINGLDAERLLKRLGWTEPGNANRA